MGSCSGNVCGGENEQFKSWAIMTFRDCMATIWLTEKCLRWRTVVYALRALSYNTHTHTQGRDGARACTHQSTTRRFRGTS
jgi:hypothetical protein